MVYCSCTVMYRYSRMCNTLRIYGFSLMRLHRRILLQLCKGNMLTCSGTVLYNVHTYLTYPYLHSYTGDVRTLMQIISDTFPLYYNFMPLIQSLFELSLNWVESKSSQFWLYCCVCILPHATGNACHICRAWFAHIIE